VLAEGESEAAFIRSIQLRSTVLNFDFEVHVYGGKGTRKNLVHYILEKNRQGIRVDLCLDFDGQSQSTSFLDKLKQQSCAIQSDFGFKRDFESAFPPEILHAALAEYFRRFASTQPQKASNFRLLAKLICPHTNQLVSLRTAPPE
jgi:hypothetical protein